MRSPSGHVDRGAAPGEKGGLVGDRLSPVQISGFFGGILIMALFIFSTPPESIGRQGWMAIGAGALMLLWWLTEALPLGVTALVPIVLFPPLGLADSVKDVTKNYGQSIIFLFVGGFIIGIAMQKWRLHERIALGILSRIGSGATAIIAGFMISTAFLSMWMSNTATTLMMLPVALSVLQLLNMEGKQGNKFGIALLLAVAFAANIGGTATIIGTPPNALLASFLSSEFDYELTFATWMSFALPFALVMLVICWFVLTRVCGAHRIGSIEGAEEMIQERYGLLGRMTFEEKAVSIVFMSTALLWLFKRYLPLPFDINDVMIAIAAGITLFILPASKAKGGRLMERDDLAKIPWDVLLLFGGGLNLAAAMSGSGLTAVVGDVITGMNVFSGAAVMLMIVFLVLMMTEVMGNMALITAMLPILVMVAINLGIPPMALAAGATLASSCAFMLPMGTPPNSIVFASGKITIPQMARVGICLNIIASILIWGALIFWAPRVFGG